MPRSIGHPRDNWKRHRVNAGFYVILGMTTGLERAARALCELDANPPYATMDGKPLWQDYLPEAWAAIMALREPDTSMISAAALKAGQGDKRDFGGIFRAIIDAAMIE